MVMNLGKWKRAESNPLVDPGQTMISRNPPGIDPVTKRLRVTAMATEGCTKRKIWKWLPGTGSNRRPSD